MGLLNRLNGWFSRRDRAMAFYNRALAHSAIDEKAKAAEDLTAVFNMPGLPDKDHYNKRT